MCQKAILFTILYLLSSQHVYHCWKTICSLQGNSGSFGLKPCLFHVTIQSNWKFVFYFSFSFPKTWPVFPGDIGRIVSGCFLGCLSPNTFQDRCPICLDFNHGSYCSLQLQGPQALNLQLKPGMLSIEALPSTITTGKALCIRLSPGKLRSPTPCISHGFPQRHDIFKGWALGSTALTPLLWDPPAPHRTSLLLCHPVYVLRRVWI